MIEGISAVTLGTHEMPRAVRFYRALGFAWRRRVVIYQLSSRGELS
jgi:catechol 2,3-dioxygenase-like lactoylglutathione lyase family enzyme